MWHLRDFHKQSGGGQPAWQGGPAHPFSGSPGHVGSASSDHFWMWPGASERGLLFSSLPSGSGLGDLVLERQKIAKGEAAWVEILSRPSTKCSEMLEVKMHQFYRASDKITESVRNFGKSELSVGKCICMCDGTTRRSWITFISELMSFYDTQIQQLNFASLSIFS